MPKFRFLGHVAYGHGVQVELDATDADEAQSIVIAGLYASAPPGTAVNRVAIYHVKEIAIVPLRCFMCEHEWAGVDGDRCPACDSTETELVLEREPGAKIKRIIR